MGSVKDLKVIKAPASGSLGLGDFFFTDDYSVKDWGKMPDVISLKGASIALMAAMSFELAEASGFETDYVGLVENGEVKRLAELDGPCNVMRVKLANVIKPVYNGKSYDYSFFKSNQGKLNAYVIPVECVYRNGLPKGSSALRDLRAGKAKPEDFGLSVIPDDGVMLLRPVCDFSSKFEESGDRKIKARGELLDVSGLTDSQFSSLENVLHGASSVVSKHCSDIELIDWDGKLEFIWYEGKPVIADVLGTPDENRFSLGALQVSKEVVRQWYDKNQPAWAGKITDYKKLGPDWRQAMIKDGLTPVKLPSDFVSLVGEMYAATANLYCQRRFFDVRPLADVMKALDSTGCAIYVK